MRLRRAALGLSMALYVASFLLNVFPDAKWPEGIGAYAFYWALILPGFGTLLWVANPLLWFAWMDLNLDNDRRAFRLALLAVGCAIWVRIGDWIDGGRFMMKSYGVGYYVWVASMGVIVLAAAWRRWFAASPTERGFDEPSAPE